MMQQDSPRQRRQPSARDVPALTGDRSGGAPDDQATEDREDGVAPIHVDLQSPALLSVCQIRIHVFDTCPPAASSGGAFSAPIASGCGTRPGKRGRYTPNDIVSGRADRQPCVVGTIKRIRYPWAHINQRGSTNVGHLADADG